MKIISRKHKGRLILSWLIALCLPPLLSLIIAVAVLLSTDAGKSSTNKLLLNLTKKQLVKSNKNKSQSESDSTESNPLSNKNQAISQKKKRVPKFRLYTKRIYRPRKKPSLAL